MSDESRRDIDLNFPKVEETSTSNKRQGSSIDLPIVVEERRDDVQVLSALETSHQRDQSSRNNQVAKEPEAMVEAPPLGQSEHVSTISSAGEDFFTLLSPRIASNQEGTSACGSNAIRELSLFPVLEIAQAFVGTTGSGGCGGDIQGIDGICKEICVFIMNVKEIEIILHDEEQLEKKKAEYGEKMKNKIAILHREVEEKLAMVEAKKDEEAS